MPWRYFLAFLPFRYTASRKPAPQHKPTSKSSGCRLGSRVCKRQSGCVPIIDIMRIAQFLAHGQPPRLAQIGSYKPQHHIGQIERQQLGQLLSWS